MIPNEMFELFGVSLKKPKFTLRSGCLITRATTVQNSYLKLNWNCCCSSFNNQNPTRIDQYIKICLTLFIRQDSLIKKSRLIIKIIHDKITSDH